MGNCFYFISDQYFRDFTDPNLMKNSEVIGGVSHGRPCFYTFPDPHHDRLHWCVPISSKVSKYQEVYNSKLEKYGFCNTICFGNVLGQSKAFLSQNMFPVTQHYIVSIYKDKLSGRNVTIPLQEEKRILHNAKEVLKLHRRGIRVIYPDIAQIEEALISQFE